MLVIFLKIGRVCIGFGQKLNDLVNLTLFVIHTQERLREFAQPLIL